MIKQIICPVLSCALFILIACSNSKKTIAPVQEQPLANTLLWKISGNGLQKPSYLYGTMHMVCDADAELSDSVKQIIGRADAVYLEADMDNLVEMMAVLGKMKMRGDTSLEDLLSKEDFDKVKKYFEDNNSMLPFSMLKTFKPMMASSVLMQKNFPCEKTAMMEQVLMEAAKENDKEIEGLESISYQAELFDKIPYKIQAEQLVQMVKDDSTQSLEELKQMLAAYRNQDLSALEKITLKEEAGFNEYLDLLLYNRNRNWVEKLKNIMPGKTFLVAVGAGHLPGKQGVIRLLEQSGYTVTPVDNTIKRSVTL